MRKLNKANKNINKPPKLIRKIHSTIKSLNCVQGKGPRPPRNEKS